MGAWYVLLFEDTLTLVYMNVETIRELRAESSPVKTPKGGTEQTSISPHCIGREDRSSTRLLRYVGSFAQRAEDVQYRVAKVKLREQDRELQALAWYSLVLFVDL